MYWGLMMNTKENLLSKIGSIIAVSEKPKEVLEEPKTINLGIDEFKCSINHPDMTKKTCSEVAAALQEVIEELLEENTPIGEKFVLSQK